MRCKCESANEEGFIHVLFSLYARIMETEKGKLNTENVQSFHLKRAGTISCASLHCLWIYS